MTVLDRPSTAKRPSAASPPAGQRARVGSSSAWLDAVALVVGLGAVATPVATYFTTSSWFVLGLVIVAGVVIAATITRALTARRWVALVVTVATATILVTATLTPGEGFALLLPSPASIAALQDRIALGAADLAAGAAPMAETEFTIVALAAAVVLVGVLATALVVLELHALVGLVLLVLWVIPGTVNGADGDVFAFLIAGACWLVLLTAPGRRTAADGANAVGRVSRPSGRRLRAPAIVAGAVAIILAILGAPLAPKTAPLTGPGSVSGFFDATGIDQTIALGEQLRAGSSAVMLRYQSEESQYLRVLTLTDFTGTRWVADPPRRLDSAPPDLVVPGPGETPVETVVRIDSLRSRSLPIPINTEAVAGLPPGWRWNTGFATVSSEFTDTGDLEYAATSVLAVPDRADLAVAAPWADPTNDAPELGLPERTPQSIIETAAQVTAGAVDDYERALALQDWLRNDGGFVYSVNAPVREGFDGSGLDALETFLEVREGYCVHFASAMAVMARTLDIPSRISIGFAPGDATVIDAGETEWVVTGEDLHAWPELWFENVGWVPFEPTPGLGLSAADPIADAAPDDDEVIAPTTAPTTAPTVAPDDELDDGAAAPGIGGGTGGFGQLLGLALGFIALLLTPAIIRAVIRSVRLRPGTSAHSHWAEVVSTSRDLGMTIPSDATPRVAAAIVEEHIVSAVGSSSLAQARDAVERARYGPPDAAASVANDASRRVVREMRAQASPSRRVLAFIAPRSLLWAARSGIRTITSRYAGAS